MPETNTLLQTQPWLLSLLADPITKQSCQADAFPRTQGVIDARVFLKNTYGFDAWLSGQQEYEDWADNVRKTTTVAEELEGIKGVRPVYEYFPMAGRILDVGGGRACAGVSAGGCRVRLYRSLATGAGLFQ